MCQKYYSFPEVALVSIQAVREYIALLWGRYQELVSREDKGEVLDEICRNLKIHRKAANRLMRAGKAPSLKRGPTKVPSRRYSERSRELIRLMWRQTGYINSVRLKGSLADWLPHLKDTSFSEEVRLEALRMSASTMERVLKEDKAALRRRLNSGTRSHKKIVTQVPIRNLEFEAKNPGFGEVDTVMHCGERLAGKYIKTLTFVDLAVGWVECEAMPDHTGFSVKKGLIEIEKRLPVQLLGLYADGGLEFWNDDVMKGFIQREDRHLEIDFGRGRPYKKNDQKYVEQKNFTHVRQFFGWDRITGRVALNYMNNIYRKEWRLLNNFFLPQMRLLEKQRIGSRVIRKMDSSKTPYQRILESSAVPVEVKNELVRIKESLDPFELRRKLTEKLRKFRRYLNDGYATPHSGRYHDKVE